MRIKETTQQLLVAQKPPPPPNDKLGIVINGAGRANAVGATDVRIPTLTMKLVEVLMVSGSKVRDANLPNRLHQKGEREKEMIRRAKAKEVILLLGRLLRKELHDRTRNVLRVPEKGRVKTRAKEVVNREVKADNVNPLPSLPLVV